MHKEIIFKDEARKKLKSGVDKLASAVSTTLGAEGCNVAIDKAWQNPQIINDGVSIAKEVTLKDKFENVGAQLVREAAAKTNDLVGDGTTTSVVLTQAILEEAFKVISHGESPMSIRRHLLGAQEPLCEEIRKKSRLVSSLEEKRQVASVSAQDDLVGAVIANAVDKAGENGSIVVEESKVFETSLEFRDGITIDNGYVSPYMVTDKERAESVINEPQILLLDREIADIRELSNILEQLIQLNTRELVIITRDITDEAIKMLVVNKMNGLFNTLVIKAPGTGVARTEELEDIASSIGTTVIGEMDDLRAVKVEDLGEASKITSRKSSTVIVGGKGNKEIVQKRIETLKVGQESLTSEFEIERVKRRIAKLANGVVIIKVGANTEVELKEKRLRVEDAVNAVSAAAEEGILPGGGIALLRVAEDMKEETLGEKILKRAISRPFQIIMENSGREHGQIKEKILNSKDKDSGYDVAKGTLVNMFEAGVVDPTKVTITALNNAISIASSILTTDCLIVDSDEEKEMPGMQN